MGREDRLQRVLAVLEQSGCAMRSIDVFRNCKLRGADFERRVVNSYLTDLVERGDVIKVDSGALNTGELKEIPTSERGHFIATSAAKTFTAE